MKADPAHERPRGPVRGLCLALGLALPVWLSGCAAPYAEPISGPTATVTYMAGAGAMRTLAHHAEDGNCSRLSLVAVLGPQPTAVAFSERLQIVPQRTVKVKAGVPLFSQFSDSRVGYVTSTCRGTAQFVPAVDGHYTLVFSYGVSMCRVQVLTQKDADSEWVPEASANYSRPYCVN